MDSPTSNFEPEYVAVDTGGTFTDYVAVDNNGRIESGKVPSTPGNPAQSIHIVFKKWKKTDSPTFLHGTTVATNALLEDELADTLLITNDGLEGILEIGRGNRKSLYELNPDPGRYVYTDFPVVGIPTRDHPSTEKMLQDEVDPEALLKSIERYDPDSIAVCLVHSYRDDTAEATVESLLRELECPVVLSTTVLPRFREYERASTTVVNAGLRPIISEYLSSLRTDPTIPDGCLVMGSDGGFLAENEAMERPVLTTLSGPSAGVVAADRLTETYRDSGIISMDIGGTSTDVSLIRDRFPLRDTHSIGGYDISQPMVDMETIGSGGGSVLWSDSGNHLRVGPKSAGADPGPACYGNGGPPTMTDAQLLLGRIPQERPFSDTLKLSRTQARAALHKLGNQLDMSPCDVAVGAVQIASSQLSEAIRSVTVKRGDNPSEFSLVAMGGAGGLYAADLASELSLKNVYIPRQAGVASALGLLNAPRRHQQSISVLEILTDCSDQIPALDILRNRTPDWANSRTDFRLEAECRYQGQNHNIRLSIDPGVSQAELLKTFRSRYRQVFDYVPSQNTIELVHLSGFWEMDIESPELNTDLPESSFDPREQHVITASTEFDCQVHSLESINESKNGPLILSGDTTTVFVPPEFSVNPVSEILVELIHHE